MSKKHFGKGHPLSAVLRGEMSDASKMQVGLRIASSLVVPVCRLLDHHTVSSFSSARAFCLADPLTDPKRGRFLISELRKLSSCAWFKIFFRFFIRIFKKKSNFSITMISIKMDATESVLFGLLINTLS